MSFLSSYVNINRSYRFYRETGHEGFCMDIGKYICTQQTQNDNVHVHKRCAYCLHTQHPYTLAS